MLRQMVFPRKRVIANMLTAVRAREDSTFTLGSRKVMYMSIETIDSCKGGLAGAFMRSVTGCFGVFVECCICAEVGVAFATGFWLHVKTTVDEL